MATVTIEHARGVLGLVLFQVDAAAAAHLARHFTARGCVVTVDPGGQPVGDDPADFTERCGYCGGCGYTVEGDDSGTERVPCPVCTGEVLP